MAYERGDAQRYCGDDGDDGAEYGDRLDGVQVEDRGDDQSAPSVTCGVVSPDVFHVSSFSSEVHWLHMYSQRGGMVADNFHGDVEEFCEFFGVVVPCEVFENIRWHEEVGGECVGVEFFRCDPVVEVELVTVEDVAMAELACVLFHVVSDGVCAGESLARGGFVLIGADDSRSVGFLGGNGGEVGVVYPVAFHSHGDGECNGIHGEAAAEVTVENGVCVDACEVCGIHVRTISYFLACRLQKFHQVFTNVHTVDGNWRKVYGMVDEIFMKCVNVVESLDEGLTKIAQGSVRFVICCWWKEETGQTLGGLVTSCEDDT